MVKKRDVLYISKGEFDSLLEYSASYPTGTTIGKRWKRNVSDTSEPVWLIGEYTRYVGENDVEIKWWRPIITS